ncbi:hypothetical protein ABIC28_004348 [Rhodococcus sp. PvR044]
MRWGAIEIYLNTRGEGFPGASVIFGAIGLFSASYLAAVLAVRLQRGSLMLSSDGIWQRGWSFESYLPWESVAGATAVHHGFPETLVIAYSNAPWGHHYTTRLFRTDRLPLSPLIEVDTRQFAVDPVLLHHLVSYYANNSDTRAELGTDAAIACARARDYPSYAASRSLYSGFCSTNFSTYEHDVAIEIPSARVASSAAATSLPANPCPRNAGSVTVWSKSRTPSITV